MSDDSSAKWSDVGVRIEQNQGAIHMDMFGDAELLVSSPWKEFEGTDTLVPINVHYPTDICDSEQVANISLSLSPETARELGEWLVEHADDEPEPFPGGDGA